MVNEQANVKVTLNSQEAQRELENLQGEMKRLIALKKKAEEKGDVDGYKRIDKELKKVNREANKLVREHRDLDRIINNISGASINDLRNAQRALTAQTNKLNRNTDEYVKKRAQLKLVKNEIAKVNAEYRTQQGILSRTANGFNKYFTMVTAGIATFTGVLFSLKEFIKGTVELDDALADVMKTTGLTRKEVREMYTDFRTFNTRTPRRELLALAEEAGRLGKTSRKDIMDFVEVANQIKVALGDDLGGEAEVAIREVGKLTEIYRVGQQYNTGFRDSMLKVGSAINEVSANSNAQAPYLIDYLKRMGGVAGQAKLNASQIIGYASSLDQLGQTQEMSATAHGKVMVDMFKDQAKYAEIAQMSTADFSQLLNTDANEAFLKVLEGLNGNNEGFSVMAAKLDQLGIDGARAVQVLAVLSANTKMVREQQALANKAMDEGISLTNEYNIKNNNLAGSWDKIGQFIRSKFINSEFIGWLEDVVSKVADWTETKLADTLIKQQQEVNALTVELTSANTAEDRRREILEELQEINPKITSGLSAENIELTKLKDNLKLYNEELANRIVLANLTEDEEQEAAKVARQMELVAHYQYEINKLIAETDENIALSNDTFEEKVRKTMDILSARPKTRDIYGTWVEGGIELLTLTEQLQLAQKRLNDAQTGQTDLSERIQAMKEILGLNQQINSGENNEEETVGTPVQPRRGRRSSAFSYEEETEDPLEMESWMTSGNWDQIGAEQLAARKASEEEWTEFLKKQIEERENALAHELQIEAEIEQARQDLKDMRLAAIGDIAGALSNMFEEGSAAQMAMFALEKAFSVAQIWINLAREKSNIALAARKMDVMLPGSGIAWEAAMTAKAVAAAKINTGLIVAQTIAGIAGKKGKKEGGFTGWAASDDTPMGFYHANEWYASAPALRNPDVRKFIDIFDLAQRNGSIQNLNLTDIVQAATGAMGRQSGGYTTSPDRSVSPPSQGGDGSALAGRGGSDQALLDKLDRLGDRIEAMNISISVEKYERERNKYLKIQQTKGL